MAGMIPPRILIRTQQALLGRLLAEALTSRGYAPRVEMDLDRLIALLGEAETVALLLEADPVGVRWFRLQDVTLCAKTLLLLTGAPPADLPPNSHVLPADDPEQIEQAVRRMAPPPAAPKSHLLIVDDDPEARSTIREYFQELGYQCLTAASGMEALHKIRESLPDVVLLDLNMPELDGMDFLRVVRQLNNAFGIIVVTAMADPNLARRAISAGAFDVVGKPINFSHLAYLVRIQIQYREMRERLRAGGS